MRSCSGNRAVEQGTIVTLAKRDASSLQPTYPVKHTVRVATRLSSKNLGLAWAKTLEADKKKLLRYYLALKTAECLKFFNCGSTNLEKQEDHGKLKQELLTFNDNEEIYTIY